MLSFYYSSWWVLPIVLLAFALNYWLYRNDISLKGKAMKRIYPLFLLRFLALVLMGLLLLKPQLNSLQRESFQPKLFILQDNTQSIVAHSDSLEQRQKIAKAHRSLYQALEANNIAYKSYGFTDSLSSSNLSGSSEIFSYKGKQTNIASSLKQLQNDFLPDQIGGVLLISDGIYNQGEDPLLLSSSLPFPVYTVCVGDTQVYPDASIEDLRIKKYSYTDRLIPFQLLFKAVNLPSKDFDLLVKIDGNQVLSKSLSFLNMPGTLDFQDYLPKMEAGVHKVDFELGSKEKEANINNNKRTVFVDVLDDRQKIALLYHGSHPDLSALKNALTNKASLEVDLLDIARFDRKTIESYNLFILHGIPQQNTKESDLLKVLKEKKKPSWFIVQNTSDLKYLGEWADGLKINRLINQSEWFQAQVNPDFNPFILSEQVRSFIHEAAPLVGPSCHLLATEQVEVLLWQKIRSLLSERPALFFVENEEVKSAFLMGEGLWKWRMQAYRQNENFEVFDQLVQKIVQYLSTEKPKEPILLSYPKQIDLDQTCLMEAQLFNDNYQLVYGEKLSLKLWSEEASDTSGFGEYSFTALEKDSNELEPFKAAYQLRLAQMPSGRYRFELRSDRLGKDYVKKGTFVVKSSYLEFNNTIASPSLMRKIAAQTQAASIALDNISTLPEYIKNKASFKPRVYSTLIEQSLIKQWWWLLLIVALLAAEWFLRKRMGRV